MSAQYDSIGTLYNDMKALPAGRFETANVRAAVLPWLQSQSQSHANTGAKVLDLACGTGTYSRLLLSWGAFSVVGIDISPAMISAAKTHPESSQYPPDRLSFQVGDCSRPGLIPGGPFDIVLASWLLNYAPDALIMTAMFENIALNLAAHGTLIAVTPRPSDSPGTPSASRNTNPAKYGVTGVITSYLPDGSGIATHVTGHTHPKKVEFDTFQLKREIYERSAREGGMQGKLKWQRGEMPQDPDGLQLLGEHEDGFWDEFAACPFFAILLVQKSE